MIRSTSPPASVPRGAAPTSSEAEDTRRTLDDLLRHPGLWRGHRPASLSGHRSGFADLDRILPERGWPGCGLIEIMPERPGIGELSLLLPALRGRPQSWISPPWRPYAPALAAAGIDLSTLLLVYPPRPADALWAMEQILRSGCDAQVLGWQDAMPMSSLRRLQLAAEQGACRLFLFRPPHCARLASPAVLRLRLSPAATGLSVELLKSRGGRPAHLILPYDHALALSASAAAPSGRPAPRAA